MRYIVVTDLDGTLLDHHTYEFNAAQNAIAKLKQLNIPLILNSSKTKAEILDIRSQLNNQEPFVCENGGVLCMVEENLDNSSSQLKIKYLGTPRKNFLNNLSLIKQKLQLKYQSFGEATVNDVVDWTGLTPADAEKAMAREATEPLLWQDSEVTWEKFCQELIPLELQCVKGGRFCHVMGNFNKASCFPQLKTYYSQIWQEDVAIVAVGDSQNDLPMLEEADFAIVIPSQKGMMKLNRQDVFYASQTAPDGWQEGIDFCLNNIF